MTPITLLKERILEISGDARTQGLTEIANRLYAALDEYRRSRNAYMRKSRKGDLRPDCDSRDSRDSRDSSIKEKVKRDIPPKPPIERNPKETNINSTAGAREGDSAKNPPKCDNPDKPKEPEKRFVKPTLQEVAAYVAEKNYKFDPETFWNFYESKGWKVGRVLMKSWKSACVTWQKSLEGRLTRQQEIDAKMDERYAKRHAVNSTNAAEAVKASRVTNAILNLTESDWELCAENCANCYGKSCKAGHKLPCDHMLNQRPIHPTECTHFTKKQENAI